MIPVERASRLTVLALGRVEGAAEADAMNEEEKKFVENLRNELTHSAGMIVSPPVEFDFDILDSPDFDLDRWIADGAPQEKKAEYLRPWTPKPIGWMP